MGAMFDGDVIAGFSEIIVITFNYRLGALGKLSLLLHPHCPDLLENHPRHENSTFELL
jgi:carboxylesterase type B